MTKTVTVEREGNEGDHRYVIAEVDITSLDAAGAEPMDPSAQFNLEGAFASVLDKGDATKFFTYDEENTQILVKEVNDTGDGTGGVVDTANNTDVGTVTIRFVGDFAP